MVSWEGSATRREELKGSEESEDFDGLDQSFLALQEALGRQRTGWCSVLRHMGGDWMERVGRKM